MEKKKNPTTSPPPDVNSRILHLIDFASEDDCLISSSSPPTTTAATGFLGNSNDHEYFELSVVETAQEREDPVNQIVERKHDIMLAESSEPDRTRKTAKCNLRKSLAWDSAFFTSAGVLEPEELSILNSGLKKAGSHPLLGIEEDIRRSAESTSTLDSDNLTLESLEVGLFEDIRASIQKSNKVSHRTSSDQTGSGECDIQNLQSSRKMEFASRNKMKPTTATKNQVVTVQGLEKTKKRPENLKKEAEKTKEARGTNKDAFARSRAVQAAARSGKLNTSSLRPPKIAGRVNHIPLSPTNTSLGANRVKIDNSPLTAGRRDTIVGSKRPVFGDPSANSQSIPSPKLSSSTSVSATKMESAASGSPHSVSGSSSSNSTDKSPLNPLKKKTYSRNINLPSAALKSPRGNSSKIKTQSGNPRLEAYLTSISKLNSSISPASSLDGLSSASSSSTSVDQRYISGNNLDISSPRKGFHLEKGLSGKDTQKHHHDRLEQKKTGLPSPRSKKSIPGAGTLIRPATTDGCRSSKPSGLRMPSPKIGFFDAEKSTEIPPAGRMQFHPGVRSAIPKHGAPVGGVHGGTIRAKSGRLQPSKTMVGRGSVNGDPHVAVATQCASRTESARSLHPQGSSNSSPKKSTGKITAASCSSLKSTPQNDDRILSGSHSMTGVVREMNRNAKSSDFSLNEGENGGHADFVNDKDAARGHVSAMRTGREDCLKIAPKLQGDTYGGAGIESHLESGVVAELTNKEHFSSFPGEEGNAEELSCASTKISTKASGGNSSSITSTSQYDDRIIGESHSSTVEVEEMISRNSTNLGSFPNNRETVGEDDFVNGMDTTSEQVSALKARTEDCPSIAPKQQSIEISIDNHLKTGEVGELSERKCSSPFLTQEIGGQGSFENDAGIVRETISPTKATKVSQGIPLEQNDLYHRAGSGRRLKREVRELMKADSESIFLKEGQAICQDAFMNGVGNLREKLLNFDSVTRISTEGMPEISCKPNSSNKTASSEVGKKLVHDPSHLQNNLCHDNNEKENSLCYGNQVDLLGGQVGLIDPTVEELIGKKGSSLSRRDGKGGSTEDTILLLANSKDVLVDGHGDCPKLLLKEDVQTDSS